MEIKGAQVLNSHSVLCCWLAVHPQDSLHPKSSYPVPKGMHSTLALGEGRTLLESRQQRFRTGLRLGADHKANLERTGNVKASVEGVSVQREHVIQHCVK